VKRHHSTLRTLAWGIPALAVLALLGTAEAIVSRGAGLAAVIVGLPVAAFLAGRWHGRRGNAALARLRDDNAKLQTKIRALSDEINGPEAMP
jgi:hypothetical protein